MPTDDKLVFTLEEIEAMTGFAKRPLWNDCKRGRFAHVHRGNVIGMTLEQVRAVVEASTVPAKDGPQTTAEGDENEAIARRLTRKAARKAG